MFRATPLEKKIVERKARDSGLTTANYVRDCALSRTIVQRLTDDEVSAYRGLVDLKLNFTRISNLIKERKGIAQEVREVVELVNALLGHFR